MRKVLVFVFLNLLLFFGLVTVSVSLWQTVSFFSLSADFVVVSTDLECEQPLNNRCVRHYRVQSRDGKMSDFVPFGFEFDSEKLSKGTHLAKENYRFSYAANGVTEKWPYFWQHIAVFLLGVGCLFCWFRLGGPRIFLN